MNVAKNFHNFLSNDEAIGELVQKFIKEEDNEKIYQTVDDLKNIVDKINEEKDN
jgi:hypothetical protein